MIVVKLKGGLGNQMFQYAFGRALTEKNKATLKIDLTYLQDRTARENFTFREYALDIFGIKNIAADQQELSRFIPQARYRFVRVLERAKIFLSGRRIVKERAYTFDSALLELRGELYLDGYWQSEKYFKNIEALIRKTFVIDKKSNLSLLEKINKTNSVCLHVRRGDFVHNSQTTKFHGVCSEEYYFQAAGLLASKVKSPCFYIFSDDIEWCKQNLKLPYSVEYVSDCNSEKGVADDFSLMTNCRHFIIPNSSFGWWAAWLGGNNEHKIVVVPKQWFQEPGYNDKDLIPNNWTRI